MLFAVWSYFVRIADPSVAQWPTCVCVMSVNDQVVNCEIKILFVSIVFSAVDVSVPLCSMLVTIVFIALSRPLVFVSSILCSLVGALIWFRFLIDRFSCFFLTEALLLLLLRVCVIFHIFLGNSRILHFDIDLKLTNVFYFVLIKFFFWRKPSKDVFGSVRWLIPVRYQDIGTQEWAGVDTCLCVPCLIMNSGFVSGPFHVPLGPISCCTNIFNPRFNCGQVDVKTQVVDDRPPASHH